MHSVEQIKRVVKFMGSTVLHKPRDHGESVGDLGWSLHYLMIVLTASVKERWDWRMIEISE
jgi:hypothetical protein